MQIGFPGIGWAFTQNPEIVRFGDNFALTWYGLIIAAGFLMAVLFALKKCKTFGIRQEEIIDMLFFATPAGIIGARLYFVVFNWSYYSGDLSRIYRTWEGGLAIHGGIIAATLTVALFCWIRRISIGAMLDISAIGLFIGQIVGRFGNFVNGEVYGVETTLPWRMLVGNREVHPLFLYEALWNAVGLVLLLLFMKKLRTQNGQMFALYVAWYGLGRGALEGLRNESFIMTPGATNLNISALVAFVSFILAFAAFLYISFFRKNPKGLLDWTAERDAYLERRGKKKEEDPELCQSTVSEEEPEEREEATEVEDVALPEENPGEAQELTQVTEEEGDDNGTNS